MRQLQPLPPASRRWYRQSGPDIPTLNFQIDSLSDYFALLDGPLGSAVEPHWYRGNGDATWHLDPAALRPHDERKRETTTWRLRL